MIRTKIICTLGPACNTFENILELCRSGMNVARLNFSHGTHEEYGRIIEDLKKARKELDIPLAIMLDTKGPEIRVGELLEKEILLATGQQIRLVDADSVISCAGNIPIRPGFVLQGLSPGVRILFNDGYISSRIVSIDGDGTVIQIEKGGILQSGKGVNIPNVDIALPAVTDKDIQDIRFGCLHNIDLIAASFVRSPEHLLTIKNLLAEEGKTDIQVIAKIENAEGICNFDSIIQIADGIMVARGDLGVEVPLSEVPRLQKMMIRKCYLAGKPSVTATQMLESMIYHSRPTRAEVSDVANAIYDGTSSVMLSGETAIGKYPFETVNIMRNIIQDAESDFNYRNFFDNYSRIVFHDVPSAVTVASVKTAYSSNAKAIFAFTRSGSTARLLSRLRPEMPIISMTPNEKCFHQMAFYWGVVPLFNNKCSTFSEAFDQISSYALERGLVYNGDLVVVNAGTPFGISGTTNMMFVESIGDVLVRGEHGKGEIVYGNIALVSSPDSREPYSVRGKLLVIAKCDETYLSLIKESVGVILQNLVTDVESENHLRKIGRNLNKPILMRADGANRVLKEGMLVTLNPVKNFVYKGAVVDHVSQGPKS